MTKAFARHNHWNRIPACEIECYTKTSYQDIEKITEVLEILMYPSLRQSVNVGSLIKIDVGSVKYPATIFLRKAYVEINYGGGKRGEKVILFNCSRLALPTREN